MTRRLTPLLEDPETEASVRDVLQAGRDAAVADYDFDAGLARHLAVIQAGAPMPDWAKGLETAGTGGSAATTTAAGAGASAALGGVAWLVVPVVTAAVVAAAMWAREPAPAAPAPAVGVQAVQRSASSATSAPIVAPEAAPAVRPSAPSEPEAVLAPAEPVETVVSPAARPRAPRASALNSRVATPSTHAAPGTAPGTTAAPASSGADLFARARPVTGNVQPSPAPSEQPVREAPVRETAREAAPAPAPAARLDDARLEREMGMLAVAQRVLHPDPARALSLVRQSAREFGDTMFAPERGQLELLALVKLGRVDEAKRLARPYLARYPNGPFSDRVRRALATARVDR